jgi:hypothetical protein
MDAASIGAGRFGVLGFGALGVGALALVGCPDHNGRYVRTLRDG